MASTTRDSYEQLSYGSTRGAMVSNAYRPIIADAVATRILLPGESGALCLMDSAAGVIYTLPAPVIGMQFEFMTTVTRTSNAHKIITNAATVFLVGEIFMYTTATASGAGFAADGTTIRAISSNGTTSGGIIGDCYRVTCISATQWAVDGVLVGSGTIISPFATS